MKGTGIKARTVWGVGLNVLAMAGALLVLCQARKVLSSTLVLLFLALALDPAVEWLTRRGFRRDLAVLSVLTAVGALLALLVATLVPVLVEQGQSLVRAAPDLLERLRDHAVFQWLDAKFALMESAKRELTENAAGAAGPIVKIVGGIFAGIVAVIADRRVDGVHPLVPATAPRTGARLDRACEAGSLRGALAAAGPRGSTVLRGGPGVSEPLLWRGGIVACSPGRGQSVADLTSDVGSSGRQTLSDSSPTNSAVAVGGWS